MTLPIEHNSRPYPHEGGCATCQDEKRCNVCGKDWGSNHCTNGRCYECHSQHCTSGGSTEAGHGFGQIGISKTDLPSLFAQYDQADEAVTTAQAALSQAMIRRSECVKSIRDTTQSTGPFNHNGHACKIVQRGETFFFRTSKMVTVDTLDTTADRTSGQEDDK